jgi:hypothetical protein
MKPFLKRLMYAITIVPLLLLLFVIVATSWFLNIGILYPIRWLFFGHNADGVMDNWVQWCANKVAVYDNWLNP